MNEAELPCGSTLKVQPSDPSYGDNKSKAVTQYQPNSLTTTEIDPEKVKIEKGQPAVAEPDKDDGDSDLDDFFESLT